MDGLEEKDEPPQQQADTSASNSENYLCRLTAPANLPNIYLVLVGIGGIFVAIGTLDILKRQTDAIERQTKAVEDSITLQKTLKRQWVNLEKWAIEGDKLREYKEIVIKLLFEIVNPTDMPLELRHIQLFAVEDNQTSSPNISLAPTKSHPVSFLIKLSEAETSRYFCDTLNLNVFGSIAFKDNFGERQGQTFGHICMGGLSGFKFREYDRWLSQEEDEE